MIFERMGHFFFVKIRPIFSFTLVLLPFLLTGIYVFQKQTQLQNLQHLYETNRLSTLSLQGIKANRDRFLARYADAEPYFLDQQMESLVFLQNEIDWLSAYQKHPALAEKKLAEQRLLHLTKGKNKLSFVEEGVRKTSFGQETEEKMKTAVEMSEEDLKKILCLIENVPIESYYPHPKSPQMMITDFSLKRKTSPFKQEIFEVKLDLLKREFKKS